MEEISEAFVVATSDFLRSWYWNEADRLVKKYPQVTMRLGLGELCQMKGEIRDLQRISPDTATLFLKNPGPWWHLAPRYELGDTLSIKRLDTAIRLATGRIVPILRKYGYLEIGSAYIPDGVNLPLPGTLRAFFQVYYCYPMHLDWSEQMASLYGDYEALHAEANQRASCVRSIKQARVQQEAEDLWGRA